MAAESQAQASESGRLNEVAQALVDRIVRLGLDGVGPIKGAEEVAEEHRRTHGDGDRALDRLAWTHTRNVAATGFATGLGGITVAAVTIPADLTALYVQAARLAGATAHLRGYDLRTEEVRSVVLLTLLGSAGAGVASQIGVDLGTRSAMAALKRLPGRVLTEVNKKVGFRLVTKFGTKGVVNLGRFVPVVGGGVSATVNVATMRMVATYARRNFPPLS